MSGRLVGLGWQEGRPPLLPDCAVRSVHGAAWPPALVANHWLRHCFITRPGGEDEFIFSGRLDNLCMSWCAHGRQLLLDAPVRQRLVHNAIQAVS